MKQNHSIIEVQLEDVINEVINEDEFACETLKEEDLGF